MSVLSARLSALSLAAGFGLSVLVPVSAQADATADRHAILDALAEEARTSDPAFAGFSAAAGETLFRTEWAGGDARTPSCSACHTEDPRAMGRNAKTGRPIEPVAVSVNPDRFTDPDEVAKQFRRDCKEVLGRECTAQEKGDYITFMAEQ